MGYKELMALVEKAPDPYTGLILFKIYGQLLVDIFSLGDAAAQRYIGESLLTLLAKPTPTEEKGDSHGS